MYVAMYTVYTYGSTEVTVTTRCTCSTALYGSTKVRCTFESTRTSGSILFPEIMFILLYHISGSKFYLSSYESTQSTKVRRYFRTLLAALRVRVQRCTFVLSKVLSYEGTFENRIPSYC